jgi:hypothetical protein
MSRSHRTRLCSEELYLDRIPMPERSSSMRRLSSSSFGLNDSSNIGNMDDIDASDIEYVTGTAAISSRPLANRLHNPFRRSKKDVAGDDKMEDDTPIMGLAKLGKEISMKETRPLFKPFKSLRRLLTKSTGKGSYRNNRNDDNDNNNNNNDDSNSNSSSYNSSNGSDEINPLPLITNDDGNAVKSSLAILLLSREFELMGESGSEND